MTAADTEQTDLVSLFKMGKLLPITKIPALRHIAPSTVCRWALRGKIPCLRMGKNIFTSEAAVDEFLRSSVVASKPQAAPAPRPMASLSQHRDAEGYLANRLKRRAKAK